MGGSSHINYTHGAIHSHPASPANMVYLQSNYDNVFLSPTQSRVTLEELEVPNEYMLAITQIYENVISQCV